MGWSEQLPSGRWRACWRDELGQQRSTTRDPHTGAVMTRRSHADRVAGDMESKNRRGEQIATGRAPTWGTWCSTWVKSRVVEPSTAAIDELRINRYLKPQWSGARVNRITRSQVQAWVKELDDGHLAPGSVEKVYRLFSASMTAAVMDESIPVAFNPCKGVKLPRIAPGHERFLTRAEVKAIAGKLNYPYNLAVLLAAGTGMRWGELAGLHWQRVDLGKSLIDIVETWDPTSNQIKAYPKGHNRRAVPVAPAMALSLGDALDKTEDGAQECGQEHARGGAKCRSALVLTGSQGAPLNGKNFGRRQWREACDAVGIEAPRLHDLRHTYASWLVQDGIPLQEVQRLLGHASIVTTQRYAHLGVSQIDRVVAALG